MDGKYVASMLFNYVNLIEEYIEEYGLGEAEDLLIPMNAEDTFIAFKDELYHIISYVAENAQDPEPQHVLNYIDANASSLEEIKRGINLQNPNVFNICQMIFNLGLSFWQNRGIPAVLGGKKGIGIPLDNYSFKDWTGYYRRFYAYAVLLGLQFNSQSPEIFLVVVENFENESISEIETNDFYDIYGITVTFNVKGDSLLTDEKYIRKELDSKHSVKDFAETVIEREREDAEAQAAREEYEEELWNDTEDYDDEEDEEENA